MYFEKLWPRSRKNLIFSTGTRLLRLCTCCLGIQTKLSPLKICLGKAEKHLTVSVSPPYSEIIAKHKSGFQSNNMQWKKLTTVFLIACMLDHAIYLWSDVKIRPCERRRTLQQTLDYTLNDLLCSCLLSAKRKFTMLREAARNRTLHRVNFMKFHSFRVPKLGRWKAEMFLRLD